MELSKSKNANINYLAKIVKIESFLPHPDPETTRLKIAQVDGYNIIVSIDSKPSVYVYFPTSCEINPQLLSYANLYRDHLKNNNPDITGFFENNGRVHAIRLRGVVSEGFLMDLQLFINFLIDNVNQAPSRIPMNFEFDSVKDGDKEFWICRKYIVPVKIIQSSTQSRYQKRVKKYNRVIDTQFRFHYETQLIRKVSNTILPDDLISISSKIHGTSLCSAYVLCKRPKKWYEFYKSEDPIEYDYLYSSRSVIKNANYNPKRTAGYYNCDVWYYANEYLKPYLQKGMTVKLCGLY